MTGRDDKQENDLWTGVGVLVIVGAIAALAWVKIPLAFLLIPGAIAGAAANYSPRFNGPDGRAFGVKLVATGIVVGVVFYFLSDPLGADAQVRRFNRALHAGPQLATFTKHPWAVVPIGSAFLAVGFGAPLVWRKS